MTAKYPYSIVGTADLPTRLDGQVIYGQHMNAVQDEIIAIEQMLGLGRSSTDGIHALLDGGFSTLVERLTDLSNRVDLADQHRSSTSGVHGVTGNVVGTTDVQTLTNKTLVDPIIQGIVSADSVRVTGNVVFAGDVTIEGTLTLAKAPTITDFTNAQHDHTSPAMGGPIPISAVIGLQAALDGKAPLVHTHTRSQITDFAHPLDSDSHTGSLPVGRISGLGTAATMNVPPTANTPANAGQLVRGDDPRLTDARATQRHAATHATNGSDPVSPAMIGAAKAVHTHSTQEITNLYSIPLSYWPGNLSQDRIVGLLDDLSNKLDRKGTAINSWQINGHNLNVGANPPGGTNSVNDIWIKV